MTIFEIVLAAAIGGLLGLVSGFYANRPSRLIVRDAGWAAFGAAGAAMSLPRLGVFGTPDLLSHVLAAMVGAALVLAVAFALCRCSK